ncbi:MAG: lysoplasmalogenase [Deltaproteobacteria bacterium]|nr:lysoplasmalogenase [Deltaproteobacteria bacterium]
MDDSLGVYVGLTALGLASCAARVFAEYGGRERIRIAATLIASGAFVVFGLVAFEIHGSPYSEFSVAIVVGLVLGAIGDVALLGRSKPRFLAGLVAFLLGHVAYVVAVSFVEPPRSWPGLAGPLAALPLIVGGAALARLWPKLGSLKIPVILYVITIVTMVIAAIAVARRASLSEPHRWFFLAGAALFFLSDLTVARDRFLARAFANKAWGLPAYFTGQLLIAWSLVGLG